MIERSEEEIEWNKNKLLNTILRFKISTQIPDQFMDLFFVVADMNDRLYTKEINEVVKEADVIHNDKIHKDWIELIVVGSVDDNYFGQSDMRNDLHHWQTEGDPKYRDFEYYIRKSDGQVKIKSDDQEIIKRLQKNWGSEKNKNNPVKTA